MGDVAVFDSNSGVGNSVIGANITVQGLECDGSTAGTGTYAGTLTHNTSVTPTINSGLANSFRLTSGMTYTAASASATVAFTNTSGTAQLKSAGKALGALTINGAGGTVQLQDDLSVNAAANATLTLTTGSFDCNAHALTVCAVSGSNSNTRGLALGGTLTLGGNVSNNTTIWNFSTTTGLTFTRNSANIIVLSPNSAIDGVFFNGGGLTYNNFTLNASSQKTIIAISGANTFANFANGGGWQVQLAGSTTHTISNAFAWTGTATLPTLLYSNSTVNLATISCPSGACSLTWGGLQGITATGGATFTATNTLDFGSNSGWSITPPADGTTSGIAAAVWRDTTAGDFAVAGSIGKDLFIGGIAPGTAGGHFIAGTNAATSVTTALTANITGNITGNLSGSVGSVTGNVGGNVVGSVASVTARVTANSDQIAGSATSATNLSGNTLDTTTGVVGSGSTMTSIVTSSMTPPGSVANQFGSNVNPRMLIFDVATTTAALRNQATVVSASTNAAAPVLTVNALTTAPATTDTFRIL